FISRPSRRSPRDWMAGKAGRAPALPPPPAGEGGEGEATSTEQAASPSPALQPKSDLSDFGRSMVPKSDKPDFGCKSGGEGRRFTPAETARTARRPSS